MRVLMIPRDGNPYQELLAAALRSQGVAVAIGASPTRSATVNLVLLPLTLAVSRLRGVRILHIHWVFTMVAGRAPQPRWVRRASRAWFSVQLAWARLLGLRIVWTAHNHLPHALVFDDDVAARQELIRRADAIISHSDQALARLREFGVELPAVTSVIRHGPMLMTGARPDPVEARRRVGLPATARVVGMVGRIEAYKGVGELVAAARSIAADGELPNGGVVVVAGACRDEELRDDLASAAANDPWLHLSLGHLTDAAFADYVAALDVAVLPFREVTTSGSAIAALEAGTPVLLPRHVGTLGLPEDALVRFDDLSAALETAFSLPERELSNLRGAASTWAQEWTWADVAEMTMNVYQDVLSHPEQPRRRTRKRL